MQTLKLKKFGTVLVSRPAGREAFNAIRPNLDPNQPVQLDFAGVLTITPSWFDEFLTNLALFTDGNVELLPTTNASLLAALPVLSSARDDAVADIILRALKRMEKQEI